MTAAITDADRLAAARYLENTGADNWGLAADVREGRCDDYPTVQAFAAHRLQARKEAIEEAARVAREFANEAALTIEGKESSPAVMAVRGNVAAAVHIAAAIRALTTDGGV